MVISGRLTFLDISHGPVTFVSAWRATVEEQAKALPSSTARSILSRLRDDARYGDRGKLIEVFELAGGTGGDYRSISTEALVKSVLDAVRAGRLLAVPGWHGMSNYPAEERRQQLTRPAPRAAEPEPGALPASTPRKDRATWFEVEVVDELGDPVADVALLFETDGELRQLATSASGVARLDGARERSASVRLSDVQALRARLNGRWSKASPGPWPAPLPDVVEVWAGASPRPFELRAEERLRVMLHPPQRVRLLDHEGVPIADRACTVAVGGAEHELKTDPDGWFEFPVGVDSCPESASITWTETYDGITCSYSVDVVLECHIGADNELARSRLANLGYDVDDLAGAVAAFQLAHELPVEDAAGDAIPPTTREKIAEVWEAAHA